MLVDSSKCSRIFIAACLSLAVLFISPFAINANAQEDISHRQGRYEVFYSVFNTSFVSPEVARATGIVRAKNKGMINISVVEYEESTGSNNPMPIPVELQSIEAEVYDLVYRLPIEFKEVVEPSARYYLGVFKISNDNEFKKFDVRVLPKGSDKPIEFSFERRLFID